MVALVMIMVTMILILLKVMLMAVAIIHITLPHSPHCSRTALFALHYESTILVSLQRPLLRPQSTATQRCGRTL